MKTKQLFLITLVAISTFVISCQPDEEPAPSDARDVFVAAWTCTEYSTQLHASTTYTVHINKVTTNTTQVQVENLYNIGFGFHAFADISGSTVTIATQTYNSNQLHGNGSKTGANSISLTYYMNDGSTIDTCTSTLARQ